MDAERDELVAALRRKLTELDAQVVAHRRERADEFRRYATDLLKPVSDSVTAEVVTLVEGPSASTALEFAALYPGFMDAGDDKSILAPPPPSRAQARRTISPPPVLYHTSGVPRDGPRRPPSPLSHGRDNELQGLFTPPFLPLLDSSSYNRRPQSIAGVYDESVANSTAQRDADAAVAVAAAAAAAAEATAVEEAAARAAALTPPPPPEPKLKSALRRTSSISSSRSSTPSIKSPSSDSRHVRFSFGGEEVLPTSSPPRPVEQDLSWLMHDDRSQDYDDMDYDNAGIQSDYSPNSISVEDGLPEPSAASSLPAADQSFDSEQPHSHGPKSAARGWGADDHSTNGTPQGDESQLPAHNSSTAPLQMSGSNLVPGVSSSDRTQTQTQTQTQSQATTASANHSPSPSSLSSAERPQPRRQNSKILDDDEYDFAPLARKISSSDRLRALSKMPLEDPSTWTVVNPQSSPGGSGGHTSPSVNEVISTHHQRRLSQQPEQDQMLSLHRSSAPSPPTVEQVEDTQDPKEADARNGYSSSSDDDDEGFIAMRPARKQSISHTAPPAEAPKPDAQARSSSPASKIPAVNGEATNSADNGKSADIDTSRPKKSTSLGKPMQVQFADSVIGDAEPKAPAAAEDDDFFEFEDDGSPSVGYPLSRSSKVNGDFDNDEDEHGEAEDESDAEDHTVAATKAQAPVNDAELVAKEKAALGISNDGLDSNALAFNHRKILGAATNNGGISTSSSSSTPPGPPLGASVGSYRGRNIDLFNIVKDPRVLQQAAQLGDMDSFVGSIHDGHQPSTMAEFSSLTGPERLNLLSGTPRSLTERMAMDDVRKNFMPSSARHN
ncbi:hypothetical protein F503_05401 [Ophiostoma piceae UAMH 11346]|uniref:Uncharacterized protein n=1 Tax=Ophiostoma piceae (strain UAMH 11346) TaxID=1262450 RepID=S3CE33_OPHP1|nr:hypothetical protein F503_05401 [Ophiostoma piceae UAMH 11346]